MGVSHHTPPTLNKIVSLRTFDTYFTAPLAGFKSCEEYYTSNSSAYMLNRISCPTQILSAADDPIIPGDIFRQVSLSKSVRCHLESHGGHLGYLSHGKTHHGDHRWLDDYVVRWVQDQVVGSQA